MVHRIILAAVLALLIANDANAQCAGQPPGNQVCASPNGAPGPPSFRALVAADIPASIGVVSTGTIGQVAYYSGTTTVSSNANVSISGGNVTLGQSGSVVGTMNYANATTGTIRLQPTTGALGSAVLTLPARTANVATTTGTLTNNNCTVFDASGNIVDGGSPCGSVSNSVNDATAAISTLSKSRAGGNTSLNDVLGTINIQGFANTAARTAAAISVTQTAASSGSNIPTKIVISTSNTAGLLNQSLTMDSAAHITVTQATAPTITAGCSGGGSSVQAGSSDFTGTATGSTSAATTCTITFGTAFTAKPHCNVTGEQSQPTVVTPSTGTLVLTFASVANYRFAWSCRGA